MTEPPHDRRPDDTGDFAAEVAQRLQHTRIALGYSDRQQSNFASESGLEQSHYHKFESGARRLTLDAAMKLCRRWGLTLDWIYRGDTTGLTPDLHEAIKRVRQARPTTWAK